MDAELDQRARKAVPPGNAAGAAPAFMVKGAQPGQPVTGSSNLYAVKYSPSPRIATGSKARDAVKWEGPEFDMAKKKPASRSDFNPKE